MCGNSLALLSPEMFLHCRVELFDAVWGERGDRSSNTLTVHLGRIRRRLEGPHAEEWIRSIRGFGYQFVVPEKPSRARSD